LMKPEKWSIKIWYLADSITKYVYDFDVYMGKAMLQQRVQHYQGEVDTWLKEWC
jgi:hypothetical protein